MQIFKNKKIAILGALAAISVICTIYIIGISTKTKNNKVTTGTEGKTPYKNLTPGLSTEEDVVKLLGNPVDESIVNSTKIFEYKSTNFNFNDKVSIDQGKVSFVKQIITSKDGVTKDKIIAQYGYPKKWLYGPSYSNGYVLYVYPELGFAFIGHQNANIVLEEWYFPSTDFDSFQSLYAKGYSSSNQTLPQ